MKIDNEKLNNTLLKELKIIETTSHFLHTDLYPENQDREYGVAKYTFENFWDLKNEYEFITDAKISSSYPFFKDDIDKAKRENNNESSETTNILEQLYLNETFDYDLFGNMLSNWKEFKLEAIEVDRIDNNKKRIHYRGVQITEYPYFSETGVEVITLLVINGYKKNELFYKQLMAESKSLLNEEKYKLSYFLVYSSLENYVNKKLNSENEEERFEDKLKKLCKKNISNLNSHQIYSSIISEFKDYTTVRNDIAHGKKDLVITNKEVTMFFNYVLLLVIINETSIKTFKEIYEIYE